MSAERTFVVYSRRGCHLCEEMLEALLPLCRQHAVIAVVDVDEEEALRSAYGERVPVLHFAGQEVCWGRLDRDAVLALLGDPSGSVAAGGSRSQPAC